MHSALTRMRGERHSIVSDRLVTSLIQLRISVSSGASSESAESFIPLLPLNLFWPFKGKSHERLWAPRMWAIFLYCHLCLCLTMKYRLASGSYIGDLGVWFSRTWVYYITKSGLNRTSTSVSFKAQLGWGKKTILLACLIWISYLKYCMIVIHNCHWTWQHIDYKCTYYANRKMPASRKINCSLSVLRKSPERFLACGWSITSISACSSSPH